MSAEKYTPSISGNDSRRCQSQDKWGQCKFLAVEGNLYCAIHKGGDSEGKSPEAKVEIRNYNLAKWQTRINKFADNAKVKDLREEIGIARMLLENILDRCQGAEDLILHMTTISDHVLKIEKLVTSCHRLEERTNLLLDKSSIIQLANTFVSIITKHVNEPDVLELISDELISTIQSTQSNLEKLTK